MLSIQRPLCPESKDMEQAQLTAGVQLPDPPGWPHGKSVLPPHATAWTAVRMISSTVSTTKLKHSATRTAPSLGGSCWCTPWSQPSCATTCPISPEGKDGL